MNDYWTGIYGQDGIKNILTNVLESQRIPQALILSGENGLGKEYIAIRFAALINDLHNKYSPEEYHKLNVISEPAVKFIFPLPVGKNETSDDGPYDKLPEKLNEQIKDELALKAGNPYYKISVQGANNIKINSIRDINRFLSLRHDEIKYKVIIITDAHLMNEPAQNALLKNLEEPPENVVFILTTSEKDKLRETIISRCWSLKLDPLKADEINEILTTYFDTESSEAADAAAFAAGSVATALELLDRDIENLKKKTIEFLRNSFVAKFYSALEAIKDDLRGGDKKNFILFLSAVLKWISDSQRAKHGQKNFYFTGFQDTFLKFNERYPDVDFEPAIRELEKSLNLIKNSNANANIMALNIMFEIAAVLNPSIRNIQ